MRIASTVGAVRTTGLCTVGLHTATTRLPTVPGSRIADVTGSPTAALVPITALRTVTALRAITALRVSAILHLVIGLREITGLRSATTTRHVRTGPRAAARGLIATGGKVYSGFSIAGMVCRCPVALPRRLTR